MNKQNRRHAGLLVSYLLHVKAILRTVCASKAQTCEVPSLLLQKTFPTASTECGSSRKSMRKEPKLITTPSLHLTPLKKNKHKVCLSLSNLVLNYFGCEVQWKEGLRGILSMPPCVRINKEKWTKKRYETACSCQPNPNPWPGQIRLHQVKSHDGDGSARRQAI